MYTDYKTNHSYVIRSDFNEITNLSIINQLKENLQNHKFNIDTKHDQISCDLTFIKKFISELSLDVDAKYGFNSNDFEEIRDKLSNSNIKVCFVA